MSQARRTVPASGLSTFRMRPLLEKEIEAVVVQAGGRLAHPDANKRLQRGADFLLGSSVIELKMLEDEGLDKPERQKKLAALFSEYFPGRPTVVLDRNGLPSDGQRKFDRIVEGPIKTAVSSARKQLEQSRSELQATGTVLWVINNGYSSLSHDALLDLVARRARNDSEEIDAVVVSGAYYYGDTFDSFFDWPIDCIPVNLDRPFSGFEDLRSAWNGFAEMRMTELVRNPTDSQDAKGPIVDISFECDGTTFVMPTPPMGSKSDFFINGRPRQNSTGIETLPPLATVFAGLTQKEWAKFGRRNPAAVAPSYGEWRATEARASSECRLKPFVAMPITFDGWRAWKRRLPKGANPSVHRYATDVFQERVPALMHGAREYRPDSVLPHRFMLLTTEQIGQDLAFDVSHLLEVSILHDGTCVHQEAWANKAMFFEYALAVAAVEAILRGVDFIFWHKDRNYAWS